MTFKTTDANGVQITFSNGYTVSIQWNPGNYVADRSGERGDHRPSPNAEVAAWNRAGDWVQLGDNDDVVGWQTPEEVVAIMADIAARPA